MIAHDNFAWPGLRDWLEKQIEIEREGLEQLGAPTHMADAHRGAIDAFRRLIRTVDPVKIIAESDIQDSLDEPPRYHDE